MSPVKPRPAGSKFFCDACGFESIRWMGRCPGCGVYDSMVEAPAELREYPASGDARAPAPIVPLCDVPSTDHLRISTGCGEADRVLGGGLVPASVTLLGGEPGIGKSTLLLDVGLRMAAAGKKCVYISAEESASQVKIRADRVRPGGAPPEFYICETSDLEAALKAAGGSAVVVVDSIQTVRAPNLRSISGSVLQIRECVFRILDMAKRGGDSPAFVLVGHITKGGELAGPKILEHMVDTVLSFEGDRRLGLRFLRAQKNRFGSTEEIGVFEMSGAGLSEVQDPSAIFRSSSDQPLAGVSVSCLVEGSRAFLVEIQALTQEVNLAMPRRVATGIDPRRLLLILAVLEKRAGFRLGTSDVFLSAVGGFLAREPAADLAAAMAVASAVRSKPIPSTTAFVGEVTLTGELRSPPAVERRIAEAARLGFREIVVPATARRSQTLLRPAGGKSGEASIDIVYSKSIIECKERYL